jgi:2-methylcitrate dehydratase PrpD
LLKLLKSAIANAKHNFNLDEKNLYISKITVDEGPKMEKVFPRARGRANIIQKKTSHVTLVLKKRENMTFKAHPKGLRLKRMEDWNSRGFYEKDFAKKLEEDFKIRKYLEENLKRD